MTNFQTCRAYTAETTYPLKTTVMFIYMYISKKIDSDEQQYLKPST